MDSTENFPSAAILTDRAGTVLALLVNPASVITKIYLKLQMFNALVAGRPLSLDINLLLVYLFLH